MRWRKGRLALPWADGRVKSLMGDHILATPLFSYTFRFCLEKRPHGQVASSIIGFYPLASNLPSPRKVSEIGFVLSDSGTQLCVFNNLLALFFAKICVSRMPRFCNLESGFFSPA